MKPARLLSIGRAQPQPLYAQSDLLAHSPWGRTPLLERLFLDSPIQTRGLYVPPDFWQVPRTLTEANAAWRAGALALGGAALMLALDEAKLQPSDLRFIGVTSVTGYTTPGLDLLLASEHGLSASIARLHLGNIGCHAAVPLLRAAALHAQAQPGHPVAALAAEVCSACFQPSPDPENLVAVSLFADGAACALLSTEGTGPAFIDFDQAYDFAKLDALGFELDASGFRIVLRPTVPEGVAAALPEAVDRLLARNRLTRSDISIWALHPGGSRILDACEVALELRPDALQASRRVLRACGNMSSPSVLFVLAEALASTPLAPGQHALMAAFGPGLGIELALLRA